MKKILAFIMVAFAAVVISGCSKSRSEDEIWETALVSFGIRKTVPTDTKDGITGDLVCVTWFNNEFTDNGGTIEWKAVDQETNTKSEYILIDSEHYGQVERPTRFEGDKNVIVTAVIKMGSRSETRTWQFVVKADDWKTEEGKAFYEAITNLNVNGVIYSSLAQIQAASNDDKELIKLFLGNNSTITSAYNAFVGLAESTNKSIDKLGLEGKNEDGTPAVDDDGNPYPNYIEFYTSARTYLGL